MIQQGLEARYLDAAVELYWEAFANKLKYALGPKEKALIYFKKHFRFHQCFIAIKDNELIGIAGYDDGGGGLLAGNTLDLLKVYGLLGTIRRMFVLMLFERTRGRATLQLDGIVVSSQARGQGVGTSLLRALENHAINAKLTKISLDVIDINPRAEALYARQGFETVSITNIFFLKNILGFNSSKTMIKRLQ